MEPKNRINQNYIFVQAFLLYQKALAEEKCNYVRALNLYKQALSLIDSILEKFSDTELAVKIAERRFRLGQSTYSSIQNKIAELRLYASREEMLEIIHDCACNIQSAELRAENLGNIAMLFFSNGQKENCLRVFNEASMAVEDIAEPFTRSRALNMLALKYAEIGEYEKALTLSVFFSDITDQIRLLTDLGQSYYQKKMRERARQLFVTAIELVERDPNPESRIAGISWIAYKLADSDEFFWAIEVTESLEDEELKLSVIHQIAERLIASGRLNNLQEMIRKVNHHDVKAELNVSLAMKYAADGYFSQAREVADKIGIIALKARAYLGIAQECKEKTHHPIAVELVAETIILIKELPEIENQIHFMTMAAGILHKLKQEGRAKELLQASHILILKIPEPFKRSEFLAFLVKTSLELDQMAITSDMVQQITEPAARNQAILDIAVRHAVLDNFDFASTKVKEIVEAKSRAAAIFQIVSKNPENRNFLKKILLLEQVLKDVKALGNSGECDALLSECALLFARLEKFHTALQIQESINSDSIRDELLWKLAELKFKGDFFSEGIEIIRLIKNQDTRLSRLICLGVSLFKGDYPAATFTISDFLPTAFSFWLEEKEKLEISESRA